MGSMYILHVMYKKKLLTELILGFFLFQNVPIPPATNVLFWCCSTLEFSNLPPELCLFCCDQPPCVVSQQSWFRVFFVIYFRIYPTPQQLSMSFALKLTNWPCKTNTKLGGGGGGNPNQRIPFFPHQLAFFFFFFSLLLKFPIYPPPPSSVSGICPTLKNSRKQRSDSTRILRLDERRWEESVVFVVVVVVWFVHHPKFPRNSPVIPYLFAICTVAAIFIIEIFFVLLPPPPTTIFFIRNFLFYLCCQPTELILGFFFFYVLTLNFPNSPPPPQYEVLAQEKNDLEVDYEDKIRVTQEKHAVG